MPSAVRNRLRVCHEFIYRCALGLPAANSAVVQHSYLDILAKAERPPWETVVHVSRLRFLVRLFRSAPRFLLRLLDVALLDQKSWARALGESSDWLVLFTEPKNIPGSGGMDEWIEAVQLSPS
eukprot:3483025-Pyramimonas_sp.AAC.1